MSKADKERNAKTTVAVAQRPNLPPQATFTKGGASLKVSLKSDKAKKGKLRQTGKPERTEWVDDTSKREVHLYPLEAKLEDFGYLTTPVERFTDGGYEIEVLYPTKPETNVTVFDIETTNLDYYYQPALTDEEMYIDGQYRPDDVIGSYAVYHKDGGKAFHIYRPKAHDATGRTAWGELSITGSELTVTIPQSFLNTATYPVVVDPTFGYETIGASSVSSPTNNNSQFPVVGTVFTAPEAGTAQSVSFYLSSIGTRARMFAIYNHTTNALVAQSVSTTTDWTGTAWRTLSLSTTPTLTAAQAYVIVLQVNDTGKTGYLTYYDTGPTDSAHTTAVLSYGTLPNPATFSHAGTMKRSSYVTYTASGGSTRTITGITSLQGITSITL